MLWKVVIPYADNQLNVLNEMFSEEVIKHVYLVKNWIQLLLLQNIFQLIQTSSWLRPHYRTKYFTSWRSEPKHINASKNIMWLCIIQHNASQFSGFQSIWPFGILTGFGFLKDKVDVKEMRNVFKGIPK